MLLLPLFVLTDAPTIMADHLRRTRAEVPCEAPKANDEVVVCARREADHYRVTFVTTDPRDAVFAERTRLMHNPGPKCGITGPFLVSETCGMVAVTASTNGGAVRIRPRKLAD